MSTNVVSSKDIKREFHKIDAKNQILGRLASDVAKLLMGKNKPQYVSYLDLGDFVEVYNAKEIKVTGKKRVQKKYIRHSGYPGGLTVETFDKLMERRPAEIIKHAVKGMLPKNKLASARMTRLKIYQGEDHGKK